MARKQSRQRESFPIQAGFCSPVPSGQPALQFYVRFMKVSVILPAAGLGTRMGREKAETSRKQFMLLEGAPILIHTIRKFLRSPSVTEIVVALRPEDLDWARGLVHQEHTSRPVRLVEGGESRQASVENALATLAPDTELVAVHDAVRPFIDAELVDKVIAEAAAERKAKSGDRSASCRLTR